MPHRREHELVGQLVDKSVRLYSLPSAVVSLLEKLDDPNCELGELRTILETDPALTAKVLRVVNSAYFGLAKRIIDLGQAVTLLGRSKLRLIVLGFSLPEGIFAGLEEDLLSRYWRQTARKAVAAREIAAVVDRRYREECFLVALLEDLGLLCLVRQLGSPFCRLVQLVWESGAQLLEVETQALGFNHRQVTAALLARWCFPERIVNAIRHRAQEQVPLARSSAADNDACHTMVAVVDLAERLIDMRAKKSAVLRPDSSSGARGHSEIDPHVLPPEAKELAKRLGLVEETLATVKSRVDELACELGRLLDVEILPPDQVREIRERSREMLAEVAAQAAESLLQLESGWIAPKHQPQVGCEELPATGRGCSASLPTPLEDPVVSRQRAAAQPGGPTLFVPDGSAHARSVVRHRAPSAEAPWHDPGLLGYLKAAIVGCRARRSPLSLLLFELQAMDELLPLLGPVGAEQARARLELLPSVFQLPPQWARLYREWCLAIILPEYDRSAATELANHLLRWWSRNVAIDGTALPLRITAAVGIATASLPTKSLRPEQMLERAERCLFGSRACGGLVKSIDM